MMGRMSRQAGHSGEGAAATQTFGALTVDKRVLVAPGRTIAIASIATVSVGTYAQPRSIMALILAVLCATGGIALLMTGDFDTIPAKAGVALLVVAAILLGLYFRPQDKTHYLLISTSDGVLTRFTGPQRQTLDEACDILTRKINAGDETSAFAIDFENGIIEPLNVTGTGNVQRAAKASGNGSAAAANGAAAISGQASAVQSAGGVPPDDTSQAASRSPGAPVANGSLQNGTAHVTADQYVDFSHFLPAVVEMHRFYARQPNAEHLEQRLHELELLMRAGAPGSHQKSRLRELTGEVSQILQAYPSAVQIFQNIAGLTD